MPADDVQPVHVLASFEGEATDHGRRLMAEAAEQMGLRTGWCLERPQYVNEGDDSDWTVGVLLSIPSPSSQRERERRAYEDTEAFVAALERLGAAEADIAIEMNGEVIGYVEQSTRDAMLQHGLFAPWRERLDEA